LQQILVLFPFLMFFFCFFFFLPFSFPNDATPIIAARGLDFPAVDWVIQVDCPEDAATYIHRVGRTARFQSSGSGLFAFFSSLFPILCHYFLLALLFLLPSELAFREELEKHKVPLQKIQINPTKIVSISNQLEAYCTQFPEIKYLGQKVEAFANCSLV